MLNYKEKIYNQELYQGENKTKNYFEGWYFKNVTSNNQIISIIVGVSKVKDEEHSFIQILDNIKNKSYYLKFKLSAFKYSKKPFYIQIEDNIFSLEKIYLDIKMPLKIFVDLKFTNLASITSTIYAPNIMGSFAYIPFLECNHAVLSLRHTINGIIKIYDQDIIFNDDLGYIEKDYGASFPKKYLWLEKNTKDFSIFLAIAKIPFLKLFFSGLICILEINNHQYRFATYYGGKARVEKKEQNFYTITIKQFYKKLIINLRYDDTIELISPKNGLMIDKVNESLNSTTEIIFYHKKEKVFSHTFKFCASEIFNY